MNKALMEFLDYLLSHKDIGHKRVAEAKILRIKTKWMNHREKKAFQMEYKQMINNGYILRFKKRTGRDHDWHISLNPDRMWELKELLEQSDLGFD